MMFAKQFAHHGIDVSLKDLETALRGEFSHLRKVA